MNATTENSALVTKTLVASGASTLTQPGSLTLAGFFDLCALIDACVVLDSMRVIESPDALHTNALTTRLVADGVLGEFRPTLTRADVRRVLLRLPAVLGDRLPEGWVPGYPDRFSDADDTRADTVDTAGAVLGIDFSGGLDSVRHQVQQMVSYPSAGNLVEERMQRSLGYAVAAAAHGMDYFPDYDRVPFVAASLNELYRSLPVQLYERVSDALGQRAGQQESVSEWTMHATLAIPAASAVVLHRARSLDEVPGSILELRAEFASYRQHFAAFKAELQQADSLPRRRKLLRTYQALLAEAAGPRQEVVSVTEMLAFAQSAVAAGAAPQLPTSYTASLITQPAQWLRKWWLRRPLAVLFRLDGKLPHLSEYRQLIGKHWGDAAHEHLLDRLGEHPAAIEQTMRYF